MGVTALPIAVITMLFATDVGASPGGGPTDTAGTPVRGDVG